MHLCRLATCVRLQPSCVPLISGFKPSFLGNNGISKNIFMHMHICIYKYKYTPVFCIMYIFVYTYICICLYKYKYTSDAKCEKIVVQSEVRFQKPRIPQEFFFSKIFAIVGCSITYCICLFSMLFEDTP